MGRRGPRPSDDPPIKVGIHMPASTYQRLREHADRTGSNISKLCSAGALLELARAETEGGIS